MTGYILGGDYIVQKILQIIWVIISIYITVMR